MNWTNDWHRVPPFERGLAMELALKPQKEIEELEEKLHDTREKMNSYLKELGFGK